MRSSCEPRPPTRPNSARPCTSACDATFVGRVDSAPAWPSVAPNERQTDEPTHRPNAAAASGSVGRPADGRKSRRRYGGEPRHRDRYAKRPKELKGGPLGQRGDETNSPVCFPLVAAPSSSTTTASARTPQQQPSAPNAEKTNRCTMKRRRTVQLTRSIVQSTSCGHSGEADKPLHAACGRRQHRECNIEIFSRHEMDDREHELRHAYGTVLNAQRPASSPLNLRIRTDVQR
jgi:hypothetical protein